MRVSVALLLASLLFAAGASAKSEDREVPAFTAVHVASGIRATVELGPRKPIHLEADAEVLDKLEVIVEDGTLKVGFKRSWREGWHWDGGEVRVSIQTPELRSVGASGGSYVKATLTRSDDCEIDVSGGSEVHLTGVDAKRLELRGSGGGTLEIAGRADELDLQLSGGTVLKGKALEVRDVRVLGSGGSVASVRATGQLRGSLSGGSELRCSGGGASGARVRTSGGSSVDCG